MDDLEYSISFAASDPADRPLGLNKDVSQLLWPISWEQFQEWGGKAGDELTWTMEGPSLCYFSINRVRVARGTKDIDGAYTWVQR